MKEVMTSLISISLGTALLTLTLVSDKFKGNIRALSSLIIATFLFSQLTVIDFNGFKFPVFSTNEDDYIYSTAINGVEEIINDAVKDRILEEYTAAFIEVKTECDFNEDSYEITEIVIKADTDVPISEIMIFTEKEFELYGKVSVVKKSGEVESIYEIE